MFVLPVISSSTPSRMHEQSIELCDNRLSLDLGCAHEKLYLRVAFDLWMSTRKPSPRETGKMSLKAGGAETPIGWEAQLVQLRRPLVF
ncbi:hypothetical protein VTK73DRAFT_3420 [Phialemonium thermophilum]|uniref:Uncharacterized protein n=1 Tax=Phialemonium thermophilum TaxID=223376 RepID=A0ABR3VIM5_9PEZI